MSRPGARTKTCPHCGNRLEPDDPGVVCWKCFRSRNNLAPVEEAVSLEGEGRRLSGQTGICVCGKRGCFCGMERKA
jgi:hypothetical protein